MSINAAVTSLVIKGVLPRRLTDDAADNNAFRFETVVAAASAECVVVADVDEDAEEEDEEDVEEDIDVGTLEVASGTVMLRFISGDNASDDDDDDDDDDDNEEEEDVEGNSFRSPRRRKSSSSSLLLLLV